MDAKLHAFGSLKAATLCVTGPESTGKSALSLYLAEKLGAAHVGEYAREYLQALRRPYAEFDLSSIARAQLWLQRKAVFGANRMVILDTDALTLEIWSRFKYGRVAGLIEQMARSPLADAYLLCSVDLPWEDDPLREHPDRRSELFDLHRAAVLQTGRPFRLVQGQGNSRFEAAESAARELGFGS